MLGLLPADVLLSAVVPRLGDFRDVASVRDACAATRRALDSKAGRDVVRALAKERWGAPRMDLRRACAVESHVRTAIRERRFDDAQRVIGFHDSGCQTHDFAKSAVAILREGVALGDTHGRAAAGWVCKRSDDARLARLFQTLLPKLKDLDVLAALRQTLFAFPFLPMDAGKGANAVIRAFAEEYCGDDRGSVDAVHVLTYALIMLNTDFHNPAIHPKITYEQWRRGVNNSVASGYTSDHTLRSFYEDLLRRPLGSRLGRTPAATARTHHNAWSLPALWTFLAQQIVL